MAIANKCVLLQPSGLRYRGASSVVTDFWMVVHPPSKWRRMRWAGHVVRMGDRRGVYKVLVGKPEGKRQLGRARRRWEDNIKIDLQEVGCGGVD